MNCANHLINFSYSGFTLLRLANVVNGNGSVTSEMTTFKNNIVSLTPSGGPTTPVTFTIHNATTYLGQQVYITGNINELGNWNTSIARGPASCPNYPTWTVTINNLPADRTIEFKAIKKDGSGNVVWEGGSNRTYTVPSSGSGSVTITWQN